MSRARAVPLHITKSPDGLLGSNLFHLSTKRTTGVEDSVAGLP
jgi:hypothetical protein